MVEAVITLRNGEAQLEYAESFEKLFASLEKQNLDIVEVTGRTIRLSQMRQGKEKLTNGYTL